MKKFSKEQQTEIDKTLAEIAEAETKLTEAVETFNEWLESNSSDIEAARTVYNEKLAELQAVYTNIAEAAREYYEEKSDKWQEGEAGEAYNEWLDQLESIDLEEIDIELPDPIEMPDFLDLSEELAPTEP